MKEFASVLGLVGEDLATDRGQRQAWFMLVAISKTTESFGVALRRLEMERKAKKDGP